MADIDELRAEDDFQTKRFQAQVARLEGEKAEMAAVLRAEQSHWRAALTAWKGNETIDIDYSSGLAAEARLTAALSGEGKVWEQVKELVKVFEDDDLDEQDCRICGVVGHDHCIVPDLLAAMKGE